MLVEIWKDIKGYENLYQISNYGNVKSLHYNHFNRAQLLKPHSKSDGYLYVTLCKHNHLKNYRIHRLVAQAFIPNPQNLPQVNHKDEDKTNNRVDNLEWCTNRYNVNYGTRNKRCMYQRGILTKCIETNTIYPSCREASRLTGIPNCSISAVCRRRKNHYSWLSLEICKLGRG